MLAREYGRTSQQFNHARTLLQQHAAQSSLPADQAFENAVTTVYLTALRTLAGASSKGESPSPTFPLFGTRLKKRLTLPVSLLDDPLYSTDECFLAYSRSASLVDLLRAAINSETVPSWSLSFLRPPTNASSTALIKKKDGSDSDRYVEGALASVFFLEVNLCMTATRIWREVPKDNFLSDDLPPALERFKKAAISRFVVAVVSFEKTVRGVSWVYVLSSLPNLVC